MKLMDSGTKFLGMAAVLLTLVFPARLVAAERQYLTGHVPAAVARLAVQGNLPATNWLHLAIGLPLRNRTELTNLLAEIYRPGSTNYRHYLKPGQFAERFGPSTNDYVTLTAFLQAQGLTVTGTHANRTLLDVAGSVSQIQQTFHTRLRLYRHPREPRFFYAPDAEPSLDLAVPVLHISGLDDWVLPHPMNLQISPRNQPVSGQPWTGSAPGGAYWGLDFRTAYVPGTLMTGQGQQVGLLQLNSGFFQSDITRYENDAGLPKVPVTPVLINNYDGGPGLANDECSLDIEMAISMAPGLQGVLVYEGSVPDDVLNQMATDDLANQLSSSYGFSVDATTEQTFQQFAAQGQSFFNASGDNDAWVDGVTPPSDDPNLTSVGGTTLTTDAHGAWAAETVWQMAGTNGSGGGISTDYAIPAWQQGIDMTQNQGSTLMRNIPDVALTADNVYVYFGNGSSGYFGGTSCASPLWAGFTALVNEQAANNLAATVGFVNPAIYALGQTTNYASSFHDIITGNNTNAASNNLFFAVPGYDLCTGWGTPAGQGLINALAGPALPTPPFLTSQPQSQTVTVGATVTLSAQAGGYPPLGYQWAFDGTNIAGATNGTLLLNDVQLSQAGNYRVLVTNEYGATLSGTAVLTVEPPSACDPTPSGLVSWWAAEGNANDSMGLNNGTVVGSLGYASGEVGQAFVLDGSTSYITIPASPSLDIGSTGTGITIECWINPSDYVVNIYGAPIVEWDSAATDGVQFWADSNLYGNIKDNANNAHTITSALGVVTADTWQHVALTYDEASGNAFIYLNGAVVAAQNLGSFTPETSFPMNIGSRTAPVTGQGDIYSGLIDEVSIYNRALGSNEIQGIYLAGSGGKCFAPPVIEAQPTNQTASAGNSVEFSVVAAGSGLLSYQWLFQGGDLPGATNDTLILNNVQLSQAGDYSVLVTNAFGAVLSSNAVLTVNPPLGCTAVPSGMAAWWAAEGNASDALGFNNGTIDGALSFAAGEVGQAFVFDGSSSYITVPASPSMNIGATGTGITIECWIQPSAFDVDVSGGPIIEWDSTITDGLQFWSGGNLNANLKDTSGHAHTIQTALNVLNTNNWQHVALTYDEASGNAAIYLDGTVMAAQNLGSFVPQTTYPVNIGRRTGQQIGLNDTYSGLMDELSIYNRALGSNEIQAIYLAGSNGKCFASPVIVAQPASQLAYVGNTLSLGVTADGTPSMSYQWLCQETNLPGATNAFLTLTNIQLNQAGDYSVLVTNSLGSALSSNAVVTVVGQPPAITLQPTSQTAKFGNTAVFGANATGSTPLYYQWKFQGTNLVGATNLSLTLTNVQFSQAGNYSILVTNAFGSILSSNAALTVLGLPPLIVTQPMNQTVVLGKSASFSVTVSGTPPIFYNWIFGGVTNIPGATNSTLTLTNTQIEQAGYYSVVITNAFGSTQSSNAFLSYFAPPAITSQPVGVNVKAGSTATFKVTATGATNLYYQWYWNTITYAIPSATNATFVLANAQLTNAGNYFVLVTNLAGTALSSNASLVVHLQDHFAWSAIPSPRFVKNPFTATIVAQNAANGVVTNFTGTVTLTSSLGLAVQPAVSGAFVRGSWTGSLVLAQPATNLVLKADDGLGETGLANAITLLNVPVLGSAQYGGVLLLYWPTNPPGFVVETTPRLNGTNWTPMASAPDIFGNQYLEAFPMTTSNGFYRLFYTIP